MDKILNSENNINFKSEEADERSYSAETNKAEHVNSQNASYADDIIYSNSISPGNDEIKDSDIKDIILSDNNIKLFEYESDPLSTHQQTAENISVHTSPIIFRFLGSILCLVFCAASVYLYTSKISEIAETIFSQSMMNIVNKEVFDNNLTFHTDLSEESAKEETDEQETKLPPEENTEDKDNEDKTEQETKRYDIKDVDLSCKSPYLLSNETKYKPDVSYLAACGNTNMKVNEIYEKFGNDAPCILIVHTHGTESYSNGDNTYSTDDQLRTNDTKKNVVSVGDTMEEVFKLCGINVIHDRNMYDSESYKDSYARSFASVRSLLEKNPSISYVFDVHRDSIIDDNKIKYRPKFYYEGLETAQMMMVVGTDEGGADHESWEENLSFALDIQKNAFSNFNCISRNINLRSAAFNQGLSNGSLLLEIGSCANTLIEAKRCAVLCAVSISKAIDAPSIPSNEKIIELLSFTEE